MHRSYDIGLVALAVGMRSKWVDNLLSHHELPGVSRSRQGVQRRITDDGLLAIELVRMFAADLDMSVAKATLLARAALDARSENGATLRTPSGIALSLDLDAIERRLTERVVDAVDSVARVPRGRPAKP